MCENYLSEFPKKERGMKIKQVLGMKVLDRRGLEVGKVNDVEFDPKNFAILHIEAKSGFRRKYKIKPEWIASIGEYMLLNVEKSEVAGER